MLFQGLGFLWCATLRVFTPSSSLLKNVFEAADARQKLAKKRSLHVVNEHFEPVFNAAAATQIVFQQAAREALTYSEAPQYKQLFSINSLFCVKTLPQSRR